MCDYVVKTQVVVLYYTDGGIIKFPICFRIYYQETSKMPWLNGKKYACIPKYELGIEMLQWAINKGFPRGTVLADAWFGISPFVDGLKRLGMSYVIEIKESLTIKTPCKTPKLTKTGKLAKNQYDQIALPDVFKAISPFSKCGFAANQSTGKEEKVLYHTKVITTNLNAISGRHRIVQSIDPQKGTTKYLLTNELSWEAAKTISVYSHRWVIEEFFRNAKQLSDMEGATIRSEQGVTLAICLVFWIDSLLHYENYKLGTAGKLPKEPLTVPSIIRQAQYDNLVVFLNQVQEDSTILTKWFNIERKNIERKRKKTNTLIELKNHSDCYTEEPIKKAA